MRGMKSPGVHFPPPFLFAGGLLLGWFLDRRWIPLRLPGLGFPNVERIGTILIIIGACLGMWGAATFLRARTAIVPFHPASRLIESGPYRFTRNPMYTGLTIVYLGVSALLDSVWPFVILPIVLFLLMRLVIVKEEAYLHDAFGDDYAAYKGRVRRWL
jgi:protein-S-isoprenylcysteine O-methyltransferase Ste14